jgi:lactam utilization protein B
MMETVKNCKEDNIKVGAHPGLPDLQGFGRREMKLSPEELTAITVYQVGALKGFLERENLTLHHVKPHGVLCGMMCRDYDVAKAVMQGIPEGIPVFGLAGTNMEKAACDLGIPFWAEMYGDVKYSKDDMYVSDRPEEESMEARRCEKACRTTGE